MTQRTFVMVKPDGVKRQLVGEILSRFEKAGLKLVALKMVSVNSDFAKQHYTDDITKRRGETVRNNLLKFVTSGPVVAMAIEGVQVIEVVRKMVGGTEPRTSLPGTIRGDYSHHSYAHTDKENKAVENLIHASADEKDAKAELALWFSVEDLNNYQTVHEAHTF